jgi:cholesterol transport system auxiliary component
MKLFFLGLLSFLLAGCSIFSPVNTADNHLYVLNKVNANTVHAPTRPITLMVMMPTAVSPYNTPRMAYVDKPYQINYFSKNRWVDTPGQMLQPLIAQSLQNTGHFQAVITPPFSGHYDAVLNTQLIELHQNFLVSPSQEYLVLRVQLVNASTQRIIATREFTAHVCAPEENPQGGVIAANQALAELLGQLSRFCVRNA